MRRLVTLVLGVMLLAGCAVGKDAVVQGSDFEFVSPGGKTEIFYPADQRQALPDLSGDSLQQPGTTIHVSDYAGDVVVLNLWGQWCGPCRAEAPELSTIYDQTRTRGVRVLGLDERDERSAALDFVHDNQISYPSIFDPAGRALLALNEAARAERPVRIRGAPALTRRLPALLDIPTPYLSFE